MLLQRRVINGALRVQLLQMYTINQAGTWIKSTNEARAGQASRS